MGGGGCSVRFVVEDCMEKPPRSHELDFMCTNPWKPWLQNGLPVSRPPERSAWKWALTSQIDSISLHECLIGFSLDSLKFMFDT